MNLIAEQRIPSKPLLSYGRAHDVEVLHLLCAIWSDSLPHPIGGSCEVG